MPLACPSRLLRLLHVASRSRDIKDLEDRIAPNELQQVDLIAKVRHLGKRNGLTLIYETYLKRVSSVTVQSILGQTAPMESNFEQTLSQSVKRALYYLHVSVLLSDHSYLLSNSSS